MPRVVESLTASIGPAPNRLRWTRTRCDAIRDAGILTGRYELIDGEVISLMGQKPGHSNAVMRLLARLSSVFDPTHVRPQLTIDVGAADPEYNEPEPDVAVTAEPSDAYATRHPGPPDLLLVAEVSDSTLRFDRSVKAALYARAGISEYWVVDLAGRQLFVHRNPDAGGYREVEAYSESESVRPLNRPDAMITVRELLPPA